ncbi:MAG: CAP domain-containing protein, partial [Pseudomonas sp.]
MRVISFVMRLAALSPGLVFAATAVATEETQLLESINAYRSQVQRCAGQASQELPPLAADPRLVLSAN